jgi:hypothetical protein
MRMTQEQLDAYIALLKSPILSKRSEPASPGSPSTSSTKSARQKYGNRKTRDAAGVVHDASGELKRWEELKLMERAGAIRSLRRQVPYALVVNGVLICSYTADFVYQDGEATVVEDHKSPITRKLPQFRHKVKLMQALHGIQVREV